MLDGVADDNKVKLVVFKGNAAFVQIGFAIRKSGRNLLGVAPINAVMLRSDKSKMIGNVKLMVADAPNV